MARLKSRQQFPPGGFKFYQPETKWQSTPFASFDSICAQLIAHRNANPALTSQHGWRTDPAGVADEVDEFNARICEQMGWTDYVQAAVGGAPPPFFPAPSPIDQKKLAVAAGAVKKIWAGIRTINDWLDAIESAPIPGRRELIVPLAKAATRAAVCVSCPQNGQGVFTSWFTKPASDGIMKQIERAGKLQLSTPEDEKLNVCEVCLCPMKLKVHTPMNFINAHLSEDVLKELETAAPGCWILAERKA